MAPYTEPASNRVETAAPGSGRGPEADRCAGPHAATPAARTAIAAARLTCSTSNPGVSFARSHAQREPRRSDHRRLPPPRDRKSTRLNSSHGYISYAVFCLKKKKNKNLVYKLRE